MKNYEHKEHQSKTCTKCGETYPATTEYFGVQPRGLYGLKARCKPCVNEYSREWSGKNMSWHLSWQEKKRYELADWVDTLKTAPCTDCGLTYPPYVMDWDHLPEFEKVKPIGVMVNNRTTKEKILSEIAKCELVCANCHRERTAARGQWGGRFKLLREEPKDA